MQTNACGEAASIVEEFTVQPDALANLRCEAIRLSISTGLGVILGSLAAACNADNQRLAIQITSTIVNAVTATSENFEKLVLHLKTEELERRLGLLTGAQYSELRMDQSHSEGMCAALGAGLEDRNFQRTAQMTRYIEEVFKMLRKQMSENFMKIVSNGTALNKDNCESCTLSSWMARGDWTTAAQRFLPPHKTQYERYDENCQ